MPRPSYAPRITALLQSVSDVSAAQVARALDCTSETAGYHLQRLRDRGEATRTRCPRPSRGGRRYLYRLTPEASGATR